MSWFNDEDTQDYLGFAPEMFDIDAALAEERAKEKPDSSGYNPALFDSRSGSPVEQVRELADEIESGWLSPLRMEAAPSSSVPRPPAELQAGFVVARPVGPEDEEAVLAAWLDEQVREINQPPPVEFRYRQQRRVEAPRYEEADYPQSLDRDLIRQFVRNQTDPELVALRYGLQAPTNKRSRILTDYYVEERPVRQRVAAEAPAPRRSGYCAVPPPASLDEVMARECADGCLRVSGTPKMYVCVPNDDNRPIKDITSLINKGNTKATTKHPCEFSSFAEYKDFVKGKNTSSSKLWKLPKWEQYCCGV